MERVSFAAGCFWGVEHGFKQIAGVSSTQVGYQGGSSDHCSYKELCGGNSGHAEVVEVVFDPQRVTFERLLTAFFFMHDASELNRQGPDVGTQYRSAIFPTTDKQKEVARAVVQSLRESGQVIETTIETSCRFIEAEVDHQNYLEQNPGGYCHITLDTFRKLKVGAY